MRLGAADDAGYSPRSVGRLGDWPTVFENTDEVRAGVCPDASTLVNDVLRSLSEHRQQPFATTPELEAWLLESADSPTTPLIPADFDAIRSRVRARLGGPAA